MCSNTHIAEKTLRTLQRRRSTPAYYQRFKRKVKCRGGRPCESCMERNHPEICHVEEQTKGSRRHPKGKTQNPAVAQEKSVEPLSKEPNMGEFSTIKFIKNNLGAPEGKNDTLYAMGISSPGFPISFTTLGGSAFHHKEPAPLRAEILQYYSPFRDLVMPMYPIVPDPPSLESLVKALLRPEKTHTKPDKFALVLSCLALGAQFTEVQINGRWEISQDLIDRANIYLRKANSIFEPSTEAVQAFLIVGIALQNLGLSNGAWNLLGLTYRCAQSLGFHKCTDVDEAGRQGAMLWAAITWQDALMSLRYDRTPLTPRQQGDDAATYIGPTLQSYHATISKFCWVSIRMLHEPGSWRCDPQNVSSKIEYVENVVATAQDHLSPLCTSRTLQQEFQFYAVRVHSSLMIAELFRPVLQVQEAEINEAHKAIRQKGIHYLFVAVESFLELCALSNFPFRSWSLMQAAVSCAFVLALIDSKHPLSKTRVLLRRLLDVLRMSDVASAPLLNLNLQRPEIYDMHKRSANLLESILNRTNGASTQEDQASRTPTVIQGSSPELTIDENSCDLAFNEFLNWPTEVSLFDSTFSDAILQANWDESVLKI